MVTLTSAVPTVTVPKKGKSPRIWGDLLLVLPGLALIVLVGVYPFLLTIWNSFTRQDEGQNPYAWLAANPIYIEILGQTLFTAVITVIFCLLLGYPYAYLMANVKARTRNFLLVVALLPFWVSGLVRIFAWIVLLQTGGPIETLFPFLANGGLLGTQFAVQIGLVQVLLPFMILPLYNSVSAVDPRLMRAAESLGARKSTAFRRVFLPLTLPGIQAGCAIVFMLAVGFYVLPQMLGDPSTAMIGNAIFMQGNTLGNLGRAGALSVILIVGTGLLFLAVWAIGRIVSAIRKRSMA